jgi:hypothetical protein
VALFSIDTATGVVALVKGWKINGLSGYEVVGINFEGHESAGYYLFVHIQAITCASSPSTSYIVIFSLTNSIILRAFPYSHACPSSNSYLNKLMVSSKGMIWDDTIKKWRLTNEFLCHIGFPSIKSTNKFTLLTFNFDGTFKW